MISRGTGDGAVLLQALGPDGQFNAGYTNLASAAESMVSIREAHDFYPVLFYFRFPAPYYSAARMTLIALDTVALIRAAIPDGKNGWIKNAASVSQLSEASLSLLQTLEHTFRPGKNREDLGKASDAESELWPQRYYKVLELLRKAGIETVRSEGEGADAYVAMRACWKGYIVNLSSYMPWRMDEIDVATQEAFSGNSIGTPHSLPRP